MKLRMQFTQARDLWKDSQLAAKAAEFLLQLSYASLGATILLIPLRYRWTIQERPFPPVYPDYTNLFLYAAELPLIMTVALWLASLGLRPKRISFDPITLTCLLAGLVIVSTISIFSSADPQLSLYHAVKMMLLFGLYLYLINEINRLSLLLVPAGLQILSQSVIGVTQVLRQHSLGLAAFQELTLDPTLKGISIVWSGGVRSLRAYGLTAHPNLLGGCLAFALILLAAGTLQSRPAWRPWLGGLFGLGALALLLTFSRAAWLALLAGLAWIGAWAITGRRKDRLLGLAGLCGGTLLLLLPFLWSNAPFLASRINLNGSFNSPTPENQSIQERSILFMQAGALFLQHPIRGIGVGAFPEGLHDAASNYPFDYQPPHLVLMEVAAETGLPGVILYLSILVAPWALLFRIRGRGKPGIPLELAGISAVLLGITVVSFLDYYPWLSDQGRLWQWLVWGLWGSFYRYSFSGKSYDRSLL